MELLLLHDDAFGLLDVMQALRPLAGADAEHAADDLGDPLQQQEHAGHRDQRLERKHRHARRAEDADFLEADRHRGVVPAGVDEGQHGGQKEDDVEDEIHARLGARLPEAVEHVGAHMSVARQRVGAGHQEQRAVVDVAEVEGPGGRRAEHVAHEHLVADAERQNENQPGERLADPHAERVDPEQEAVHDLTARQRGDMEIPLPCSEPGGALARRPYWLACDNPSRKPCLRSGLEDAREVMIERALVIGGVHHVVEHDLASPTPSASPSPSS